MANLQETSPLIHKSSKKDVDDICLWKEFVDLSTMAVQVSLATVARIALTSIDSAFLGHLGTESLAASSLASVWTSVPLMGVWAGASALITLCGQAWGAKNYELTGVWLQLGIIVTSIMMIPVFVWYWCIEYVLAVSTNDIEVVRLGAIFARVLSFSIWPSLVYACLRQYFQAMGIMLPTTIVGTLSIGIAILANYIFIYGIGSWQGLGFVGSPLATVVAAWFQPMALITYCVLIKKYHLRAWGGWRRDALTMDRLKTFLGLAGPIASNSLVSNLANSMISLVAAHLGSDVIAANAVVSGLWSILWALFWGYGCATQVRVANYLGAGKPKSAKKLSLLGFLCTVVCVGILAILTLCLQEHLFEIYTNASELLKLCMLVLPLFVTGYVLESIEILTSAILTAMGEVRVIFWTSSCGTWLIELPICYFGGIYFNMGLPALWWAIVIMEIFKLSVYVFRLSRVDWTVMANRAMEAMEVTPEDSEEIEQEALVYVQAEAANAPTGYITSMPSPSTPQMTTPRAQRERWNRIDKEVRRRASFVGKATPTNYHDDL